MSYLMVDAINQQVPKDLLPGALLVLTKFAELAPSGDNIRMRVGIDRFKVMTHYADRRSIVKNLKILEKENLLVPLEKREEKKPGDDATLYELRLPKGFNKEVIDANRQKKVYSGEVFKPYYTQDTIEEVGEVGSLPPVLKADMPTEAPDTPAKNPSPPAKITPNNKQKRKTNNRYLDSKNLHSLPDAEKDIRETRLTAAWTEIADELQKRGANDAEITQHQKKFNEIMNSMGTGDLNMAIAVFKENLGIA